MLDATPQRRLLTREQVLAELRKERERDGLTATALRYGLAVQQVSDVLAGRTKLSRRMWTKMRWKMFEFFERMPE